MERYPVFMDWKNYYFKMSILKTINSPNAIPIKIPIMFVREIEKNTPKIFME